ncbi:hypothetical protein ABBQ38_006826 [Trebouxia sp. C0009 RCD-2024]
MFTAATRPSHRSSNWDTRLQQRKKFTVCIKNNVREYGGGSTCLKELLANADDAKANHLTVCLDKSQYPAEHLLHDGMQGLQGPALWVCNNAKFSDQDWQNYTLSVGDSAKANDTETIGKFGKGALTAYSLTDVIQILSGDSLLILDPHCTHLHDQLPSVFGNVVNKRDKHFVDIYAENPDQLSPFLSFTKTCSTVPTLSAGKHYPGTLFRLALRTETAAQRSEISKESLSPDQIAQALHDFVQAAPDLLLFTRHVKGISVWTKSSQRRVCLLMHECSASMSNMSSPMPGCKLQKAIVSIHHPDESDSKTKRVWLKTTTHSVKGQSGDVALLMHDDAGVSGQCWPEIVGKVYSTMALPLAPTSLPVHINGDFRMSSDRRTLWAGEGDRGQGAKNKSVLTDAIAPAYAAAITSACAMDAKGQGAADLYKKWPTAHSFQPKQLDCVTSATVEQLVTNDCKVLWSPAPPVSSILSYLTGGSKWVPASEACLVQPSDYRASAVIINVGRRCGLQIPENALTTSSRSVTLFSPDKLRKALLSAGNIVKPEEVSAVLSYVTSDGEYEDLNGLHLILLNDGSLQQLLWGGRGGNKYFVFTDAKSERIYKLMEGNKHQLVRGGPLLESKKLNVMVPTLDDLGPSLPASWQHDVCHIGLRSSHPTSDWIDNFWALMASIPGAIPANLHSLALVPTAGSQLASIQHCIKHQALSPLHLQSLPSFAASTLSSIGCVCITEDEAYGASPIGFMADPLTTALVATSGCLGLPLPELLSQQRLGSTHFRNARELLADHVSSSSAAWSTLRQCPMFEDSHGRMVALDVSIAYALLPFASWEEHLTQLGDLLPWTPVKYHTASSIHRRFVDHSSMQVPSQTTFLRDDLLPAINRTNSSCTEPLLLKGLELCNRRMDGLTNVFIDSHLHPINRTVDSSSSLLRTLFSQPGALKDYKLLPQRYATPARLTTLKRHGLAHISSPEPDFFRCSQRFTGMSGSLTRDERRCLSRGLADMLQANVDAYQHSSGGSASRSLAACPVFTTAELQFPYKSAQPAFVSLADSADHDHYQLVGLALPVTDNSHGDTQALRCQLGLPAQPRLEHVVDHLLKMAITPGLGSTLKQSGRDFVLDGIRQGYQFIINSVSKSMAEGSLPNLARESSRLAQEAWVLVPRAASLCAPASSALTWKKTLLKVHLAM